MRKFLISAAVAATALTAAAPAAAQYYPAQQQGYGYGHHGNYGQVRRLQARIDQLQRQIARLDSRDVLSEREAARLRNQSRDLERRLRYAARHGLSGREAYSIERGIANLEYRIQREARDGNSWRNRDGRYGYADGRPGYGGYDRDRDGLDDRYERDRGTNHDEDRDPD